MDKDELIKKVDRCREVNTWGQGKYCANWIIQNADQDELMEILGKLLYRRPLDNGLIIKDWARNYY